MSKVKISQHSDVFVLRRQFPLLGAYVAPRTVTEQRLAGIWCKALGMDEVGATDSYENLGLDSLLAAGIFAEIEQTFQISIPMATLVDAPTIEQLAVRIDELVSRRVHGREVP
jgi:acyl carrier protein